MEAVFLRTIYFWIAMTCFGLFLFLLDKQINDVEDKSTFEEKYEELFKYALLDKYKFWFSDPITNYATLMAISMNLENASKKETEAFIKVSKKYKSNFDYKNEKKKWLQAYSQAKDDVQNMEISWKGTEEQKQLLQRYKYFYAKISKNLK